MDFNVIQPKSRFFQYFGGKHYLSKKLVPMLPEHRTYVELFGGSAALLLAKQPSHVEVYNDIDSSLVNLFRVVQKQYDEFMKKAHWLLYSREMHEAWKNERPPQDPVEWAVHTFYAYQISFSGKRESWSFCRKHNHDTKSFQRKIRGGLTKIHKRLLHVYIDNLDFRRCVKNWDTEKTLFFMDPPYRNTTQANAFEFEDSDFKDLAAICANMQGKFLMTINNDSYVRELLSDFTIKPVSIRCDTADSGKFTHLLIRNYPLP